MKFLTPTVFVLSLQETISIPAKTVAYAAVVVKDGDAHIYGGVHEIRRHPDYRNAAIFIPERQKKKICANERLHMSIRNRIDQVQVLEQGTTVGQVVVAAVASNSNDLPVPAHAAAAIVKKMSLPASVKTELAMSEETTMKKKLKPVSAEVMRPVERRKVSAEDVEVIDILDEDDEEVEKEPPKKRLKSVSPELSKQSAAKRKETADLASTEDINKKKKRLLKSPSPEVAAGSYKQRKPSGTVRIGKSPSPEAKSSERRKRDSEAAKDRQEVGDVEEVFEVEIVPKKKAKITTPPLERANSVKEGFEKRLNKVEGETRAADEKGKKKKSVSPEPARSSSSNKQEAGGGGGQADKEFILSVLKEAKLKAHSNPNSRYVKNLFEFFPV
jgi:hypothetical protein